MTQQSAFVKASSLFVGLVCLGPDPATGRQFHSGDSFPSTTCMLFRKESPLQGTTGPTELATYMTIKVEYPNLVAKGMHGKRCGATSLFCRDF